ncbi:hypothetical protein L198_03319 [Cryptococcus wingfieldii CBS 7118]|uniref:VPS9 domain-containing protein n=1 Tax=Cryptococcus wingfieldii CBS 7118 TaxID=1295528 RepID=A0A1E3JFM3_9TREE|nr:hypothetical protein L198_03319 [Cryptococcus wingfieldii CBS 7118]ODN99475.1 hypothetical protein L198_03319 [Cryptococcus wingfieldii CBS 7118]
MDAPQKPSLFASLSLPRTSRHKEPLAHPLLAASSPTLADDTPPTAPPNLRHKSSGSWSKSSPPDTLPLPYKPRQRHGGGIGSVSSTNSIIGTSAGGSSPTLQPAALPGSNAPPSPVTPTAVSAPPTTSTSTSTTFALPPSHSDPPAQANESAVPITASATGTSSLTSRLQLQSLKAAAQGVGLGNGSMGMSMIDAIFDKGQLGRAKMGEGGDWGELLRILIGGQAILLLPTTPSSSLPMTPQTLRDHVTFISPPVHSGEQESVSVIVTLSGLIGTLKGRNITIESAIPPDSPLLRSLKDPATRQSILASLRPAQTPSSAFPCLTLSPESAVLSFPPPSKAPPPHTPETKEKEKAQPGKLGRINPFASLFGGGGSNHASPVHDNKALATSPLLRPEALQPDVLSPPRSRPSSPGPLSPKPSTINLEADASSIMSDSNRNGEGFTVSAYTVSKTIRFHETHKALSKSVRVHIKESLAGLPEKAVDKVVRLGVANVCPTPQGSEELLKGHKSGHHGVDLDSILALNFSDPVETGERLQDFMESIYDDLFTQYRQDASEGLKRKASGGSWARSQPQEKEGENEKDPKARKEKERREFEEMIEKEASDGTERVEGLLARLLYNRLFSPWESDDSRHDEALASRIAALNMLDLSLDHLGLITQPDGEEPEGTIANGLYNIVESIGDELQKLSRADCLTPKAKTDVLIKAHKIVVDGLDNLPAVQLRPEGESYKKTKEPPLIPEDPTILEPLPLTQTSSRSSNSSKRSSNSNNPSTMTRQSSASSGDRSVKSAVSDPLSVSAVDDVEATPQAAVLNPDLNKSPSVPQLVLDDDETSEPAEEAQLAEAMSDSVTTLTETSSSVPPPKPQSTKAGTTSGADLMLPIIIYAVVKSNPPQLASQLMYLRRYRSAICLTGEASYAIVNLTAVVEFLEHVNLNELGLGGEEDKVMSIDDLSPIGLGYMAEGNVDAASIASASSRLRGRVGEFAGTAAGSANKVISEVMDSSWSAFRGFMGNNNVALNGEVDENALATSAEGTRPGMRPRQASTFSLASVTASVAGIAAAAAARNRSRATSRASEQVWGGTQELVEVSSRPGSIRERESDYPSSDEESSEEDEESSEEEEPELKEKGKGQPQDGKEKDDTPKQERVSLSNRLASIGVLGRLGSSSNTPPGDSTPAEAHPVNKFFFQNHNHPRAHGASDQGHGRRSSLLGGNPIESHLTRAANSPKGSTASLSLSNSGDALEPPIERFMTCEAGDIRVSEIGVLLRDYRRLGAIVDALNKQTGI